MRKAAVIFSVAILLTTLSMAQDKLPQDQIVVIPDTLEFNLNEIIADQNNLEIQAYRAMSQLYYGMPIYRPQEQFMPTLNLIDSTTFHHLLIKEVVVTPSAPVAPLSEEDY